MLIDRTTLHDLEVAVRAASGPIRTASIDCDLDPLDLVRSGSEAFGWAGFFESPNGTVIGGLGTASTFATSGVGRFDALDREIAGCPPGTPLFMGFSFRDEGPAGVEWEGFGATEAILPEVSVIRTAGRSRIQIALRPGSDGRYLFGMLSALRQPPAARIDHEVDHTVESRPTADDWRDLVGEAVGAIGASTFDKVVLARSVIVDTPRSPEAFDLVADLRDRYRGSRVFGWRHGDATFLGASPELLVVREGDRFQLDPLAGSAPRGVDVEEDRRLGDALLSSEKDRLEHAIVVDDVVQRLGDVVSSVTHPTAPVLQRFATVQHLATPITGTTSHRLLELVGALHPTAAVGGAPRGPALGFVEKHEGIDRGWYSGGVGWVEPGGDGEIAVALRCALVRGDHAVLYAGNGIVAGSDPDEELAETRLKLRPMLELLTGS